MPVRKTAVRTTNGRPYCRRFMSVEQFIYKGTSSICFADTFPMLYAGEGAKKRLLPLEGGEAPRSGNEGVVSRRADTIGPYCASALQTHARRDRRTSIRLNPSNPATCAVDLTPCSFRRPGIQRMTGGSRKKRAAEHYSAVQVVTQTPGRSLRPRARSRAARRRR